MAVMVTAPRGRKLTAVDSGQAFDSADGWLNYSKLPWERCVRISHRHFQHFQGVAMSRKCSLVQ